MTTQSPSDKQLVSKCTTLFYFSFITRLSRLLELLLLEKQMFSFLMYNVCNATVCMILLGFILL